MHASVSQTQRYPEGQNAGELASFGTHFNQGSQDGRRQETGVQRNQFQEVVAPYKFNGDSLCKQASGYMLPHEIDQFSVIFHLPSCLHSLLSLCLDSYFQDTAYHLKENNKNQPQVQYDKDPELRQKL